MYYWIPFTLLEFAKLNDLQYREFKDIYYANICIRLSLKSNKIIKWSSLHIFVSTIDRGVVKSSIYTAHIVVELYIYNGFRMKLHVWPPCTYTKPRKFTHVSCVIIPAIGRAHTHERLILALCALSYVNCSLSMYVYTTRGICCRLAEPRALNREYIETRISTKKCRESASRFHHTYGKTRVCVFVAEHICRNVVCECRTVWYVYYTIYIVVESISIICWPDRVHKPRAEVIARRHNRVSICYGAAWLRATDSTRAILHFSRDRNASVRWRRVACLLYPRSAYA